MSTTSGRIRGRTALLVDLDDTLYDYAPSERAARAAALRAVATDARLPHDEVAMAWATARRTVKARLGETGAGHSRLLYLAELVFALGRPALLPRVRGWERTYWTEYLRDVELRPFALDLLAGWRARGGKVAVVTDLLLEVQLWKMESLGLFAHVDALVASEEVGANKPAPAIFLLAMERLGVGPSACVMVGDNPSKDGRGAALLEIPFFQAESSEKPEQGGQSLQEIGRALEVFP